MAQAAGSGPGSNKNVLAFDDGASVARSHAPSRAPSSQARSAGRSSRSSSLASLSRSERRERDKLDAIVLPRNDSLLYSVASDDGSGRAACATRPASEPVAEAAESEIAQPPAPAIDIGSLSRAQLADLQVHIAQQLSVVPETSS